MVEWKITNIIFTIKFDTFLPLNKISEKLIKYDKIYVDYDPTRFSALILYTYFTKDDNKVKIVIFNNGLMNITGLKDTKKLPSTIEKIRKVLRKAGIELPEDYELKISNVVVNGKFDYDNIDLEKITSEIDDVKYNFNRFPGVSIPYYVSEDYKVTFNIFRNGRFVCTEIKGDITKINQHINEIVDSFQEKVIKKYAKQ